MKKYVMMLVACVVMHVACSDDSPQTEPNPDPTENPDDTKNTQVDPNFHIYLCFGQSNMEGNAQIEDVDKEGVDKRFQVMTVVSDDMEHLDRKAGSWYTATPPLCRWSTGLTPVDYFGRTLVARLPEKVKVGVIVVAMGGSGIDAFDKDNYKVYYDNADDWQKGLMNAYGGNPYAKMVEMVQKAQKSGVIKGFLLHQGESNNMQEDWPLKVKKIRENLLKDLNLNADTVPLLAGEMLYQNQGGICWGMNNIIAKLPDVISNAHVVSSEGCEGKDDFHFTAAGYRELGKRYADQMISLLGIPTSLPALHIEGRYLKDMHGKIVNLHGFVQTYSPFFNQMAWNNYDVDGCLKYNQGLIDKILAAGWKMDFVRLHMDPYWSNTPGCSGRYEGEECFEEVRFKKYLNSVFIPMAEYAISKGLYVVMRPPGVCPGKIEVGDNYNEYLKTVWDIVAQHPSIKNNPGIMFELANEPIVILGPDGTYSADGEGHFKNLKTYFQTIVNTIRANANNIIWVPGLGYQSCYSGYAVHPIEGENIGYAVHLYPGWMGSDGENGDGGSSTGGYEPFQQGWDRQVKPIADIAPIIITEMDWAPEKYKSSWGKAYTGTVGGPGFGANFKYITDNSENVSWLIFTDCDKLAEFKNIPGVPGSYTFLNDPEACPWPVYHWYKEYASGISMSSKLENLTVEGINGSAVMLTGSDKHLLVRATYVDGRAELVTSKATYSSTDPTVIGVSNGRLIAVKDGSATISITYQGPLGDSKQISFSVQSTTFPLTNALFDAKIWEKGSFDESTRTLITGQWGFGGWRYNNGVDLSQYTYLIAELGNDNECNVSFRLFDENNYWTSPSCYDFGTSRQIVVELDKMYKKMKINEKEELVKLDPSHIYIVGFWSSGGKPIVIKDVYLKN